MARIRHSLMDDTINPYIALSDLTINLVLILVFFMAGVVAVGRAGWEQVRYRDSQSAFQEAVEERLSMTHKPVEHKGKNDPPGAQRWVFKNTQLFEPGTAELTAEGRDSLVEFAELLKDHKDKWRRIRVEGHTLPPAPFERNNWTLSNARAEKVARVFSGSGGIASYFLSASGRGGQNPITDDPLDPSNERVEIVIEYALNSAVSQSSGTTD